MNVKAICDAVENILPPRRPIGHHEPYINGRESAYIMQALIDGVAGDKWVKKLEQALADYCGTQYAVAVSSGTAALHLALLAVGVKPGEEVIVPSLTFVATANAVRYCGAVPNFADGAINVNAYKLRRYLERSTAPTPDRRGRLNTATDRVISALIVVDLLGFPADMPKLTAVADEFGLTLIEDSSQALGARLGNRRCGSFGAVATLSFNNNKIVTANGGGAVLTNDEWITAQVSRLAATARMPHPWLIEHDALAYNYRMPAINAALALAQLEQIDSFLDAKIKLLTHYSGALSGNDEVKVMTAPSLDEWRGTPTYWLVTLLLKGKAERDELLTELHQRGVHARALFTPLHLLSMFDNCPRNRDMRYCEDTASRGVCLPTGVGLVQ